MNTDPSAGDTVSMPRKSRTRHEPFIDHRSSFIDPMLLPLFPLNTVLFPGAKLPLHIFEPRYRQMIGGCIEEERPFGVVLIESGPEAGGNAVPRRVGATAQIVNVERLEDGRLNIICVGQDRFRIVETFADQPFLRGEVELLDQRDAFGADAERAAGLVRERYLTYARLILAMRGEWARRIATPNDPARLADTLAARISADTETQQRLLEDL